MPLIETLKPADLEATAAMHEENLRLGLFPRLGRTFLERYQASFLESPHGIALVARARPGEEPLGVLFATASNAAHYRWVMRNRGTGLAISGCASLLRSPSLAFEFVNTRAMRYLRGARNHLTRPRVEGGPVAAPRPSLSVLSHIVTNPEARGTGVGRRLVARYRAIARQMGAERALLVTEEGGMGAGFFERLGCSLIDRREGQDGGAIREYRLPLSGGARNETMAGLRGGGAVAGSFRPGFRPALSRRAVQPVHHVEAR